MDSRIVRQPNGLLARFSPLINGFTHMNANEAEALLICLDFDFMDLVAAKAKVGAPEPYEPALAEIRAAKGDSDADWYADWCSRPQEAVRG